MCRSFTTTNLLFIYLLIIIYYSCFGQPFSTCEGNEALCFTHFRTCSSVCLCRRVRLHWRLLRQNVEEFCTDFFHMCLCPLTRCTIRTTARCVKSKRLKTCDLIALILILQSHKAWLQKFESSMMEVSAREMATANQAPSADDAYVQVIHMYILYY